MECLLQQCCMLSPEASGTGASCEFWEIFQNSYSRKPVNDCSESPHAEPATFLEKRLWHRCFPMNFAKFLRAFFLQSTTGRLLLTFSSSSFLQKNLDYFIFQSFYNLKIFQNMKNINSWYGQTSLTSSDYEWLQPWLPIALDIKNIYRFLWLDSLCCTSGKNHGKILVM